MKVNGPGDCVLFAAETKTLKKARAILDQLAYHYRNSPEVREKLAETEKTIGYLLADDGLCPAPAKTLTAEATDGELRAEAFK